MSSTKEKEPPVAQQSENYKPFEKFDAPVLREMQATEVGLGAKGFQPSNMAEAMELAKLMASSNFVPKHLRGKAGDCLAVVLLANRLEADPFAIAGKSYFVNDGAVGFEAQLIVAIINTRAPLEGRLSYEYRGEDEGLYCCVRGKLRGDPEVKDADQELKTIKIRNSPLWIASPKQQLGYYVARLWARRHCPEVLLGIYAKDEIQERDLERQPDGTYAERSEGQRRPQESDYRRMVSADIVDSETGEVTSAQDDDGEGSGFDLFNIAGERTAANLDLPIYILEVCALFKAATTLRDLEQLWQANAHVITEWVPEDAKKTITDEYGQYNIALQNAARAKPAEQSAQQQRKPARQQRQDGPPPTDPDDPGPTGDLLGRR